MWSIRSILRGSYLRKRIDPADVSLDNRLTISPEARDEATACSKSSWPGQLGN